MPKSSDLESEVDEQDASSIVLRPAGGDVYALSVDRIHDHEELVVKPAAPAVMATGLYAGTTLADDGSPILLFDPAGIAEVGGVKLEMQERTARIAEGPADGRSKATPVLLFRGLDGGRTSAAPRGRRSDRGSARRRTSRRLRVSSASRLAKRSFRSPVRRRRDIGDGKVRLFRLNDGQHEIGYAFAEVIDFASDRKRGDPRRAAR